MKVSTYIERPIYLDETGNGMVVVHPDPGTVFTKLAFVGDKNILGSGVLSEFQVNGVPLDLPDRKNLWRFWRNTDLWCPKRITMPSQPGDTWKIYVTGCQPDEAIGVMIRVER